MQRIINDPTLVVEDMLQGFIKAHPHLVAKTDNARVLKFAGAPVTNKVGIVTGGGSGHKPAFIGYIGRNLCDAVAVGEIFTSPSAQAFLDAFKAANSGKGVASEREKRRGVAGEVLMWKVGGAKAALGGSLDEVIAAAQKAIDNCRSIGVGLTPCTIPAVGKPNFQIEPGKMEVGIGHHGEPGVEVTDLKSADEIAKLSLDLILPDLPFRSRDDVVVLVSGLGATPVMELYIAFNKVFDVLKESGINVYRSYVGNYFTSLEMMGITITLMRVDDELKSLVHLECESTGLTQLQRNG